MRPFNTKALNDLEIKSITISMISIYCGILYLTSKSKDSKDFDTQKDFYLDDLTQIVIFAIFAAANLYFIALWIGKVYQI